MRLNPVKKICKIRDEFGVVMSMRDMELLISYINCNDYFAGEMQEEIAVKDISYSDIAKCFVAYYDFGYDCEGFNLSYEQLCDALKHTHPEIVKEFLKKYDIEALYGRR